MRHATFPALPDEADGLYLPGVLARAAGSNGSAGPYVRDEDRVVPIRDWLCDAMTPMAARDHRRLAIAAQVQADLLAEGRLPPAPAPPASRSTSRYANASAPRTKPPSAALCRNW